MSRGTNPYYQVLKLHKSFVALFYDPVAVLLRFVKYDNWYLFDY